MKVNRSKSMILVLYIDDILLASNDHSLLKKTKFQNFEMKDMGEVVMLLTSRFIEIDPQGYSLVNELHI